LFLSFCFLFCFTRPNESNRSTEVMVRSSVGAQVSARAQATEGIVAVQLVGVSHALSAPARQPTLCPLSLTLPLCRAAQMPASVSPYFAPVDPKTFTTLWITLMALGE